MKRTAIFSVLAAFALTFLLSSCGTKRDEALVTEYNQQKTAAEKLITDLNDGVKKMKDDHVAWTAKMNEAAKMITASTMKMDTVKMKALTAKMNEHETMAAGWQSEVDSLKFYMNAKTETNDELKSATAGLTAHMAVINAAMKTAMDEHMKLGTDIMAMITPAGAVPVDPTKVDPKKPAAKPAPANPTPDVPVKDNGKPHVVKNPTPGGTPITPSRPGGVKK